MLISRPISDIIAKIKRWVFAFTLIYFSLYLLSIVFMIILKAGNFIINFGMLFATLVYLGFFITGYLIDKKEVKNAGKFFYKYSKYFLRVLNILFLITALINLSFGLAHVIKILNIIIAVFWLAFSVTADILLYTLKRKLFAIKERLSRFPLLNPPKEK